MQVNVEVLSGLERKIIVTIPSDRIEQAIDKKLKDLSARVKVSGFRPGKVPPALIRKMYLESVRGEVINDVLGSSYTEAIKQESLRPVNLPKMNLISNEEGKGIEYEAFFEIYPVIELKDLSGTDLNTFKVEVAEEDVTEMLEKLRQQAVNWEEVSRPVQENDRVDIDFNSLIDGKPFEGGSGKNVPLVIGSKAAIPGFEAGLIGAKAGDTVHLKLRFPEDYQHRKIAGQMSDAEVMIHKVYQPELPELDNALAEKLGVKEGGMDALKKQVHDTMQKEVEKMNKNLVKSQALEKFLTLNTIELPAALIEQEIAKLQKQALQYVPKEKQSAANNLPKEPFQKTAQDRVMLGLLFNEVVKQHGIKVDPTRVESTILEVGASYGDPESVLKWYRNNKEQMHLMESTVLEEQVIEKLVEQAKLVEKPIAYKEFMDKNQKQKVNPAQQSQAAE